VPWLKTAFELTPNPFDARLQYVFPEAPFGLVRASGSHGESLLQAGPQDLIEARKMRDWAINGAVVGGASPPRWH